MRKSLPLQNHTEKQDKSFNCFDKQNGTNGSQCRDLVNQSNIKHTGKFRIQRTQAKRVDGWLKGNGAEDTNKLIN